MSKKVVIIGGGAGGASCAARIRRLNEKAEIVLIEESDQVSIASCGLPYYVGGTIQKLKDLLIETPETIKQKFRIDVRILSKVIAIDHKNKSVKVKDQRSNEEYDECYDYLVLSPGSKPIIPPIIGVKEADNIFTVSSIQDVKNINSYINKKKPNAVAVIGGGFIGIEMAENLSRKGLKVYLIEALNQVLPNLDYEMAKIVEKHLFASKVQVFIDNKIEKVINSGKKIILQNNESIDCDFIIFATGVVPSSKVAANAGLATGIRGSIKTDSFLRTNDPSIYAVGDAIEVKDYISELPTYIPLAGPANRQGRIVANNLFGIKETYQGSLGTSILKVFDMTVASTGNNEKKLRDLGVNYEAIHIHPRSHANYYPGSKVLSLKMLFNPVNGKIYGAQAIGQKGVGKRLDVLVTAIKGGLTVFDIKDLELSYAPPFSSAKDPVNMLGFIASNIIERHVKTLQWYDIQEFIKKGGLLIDVREKDEWEKGHIEEALNIPLNAIRDNINSIQKDKEICVYCRSGLRSYIAYRVLAQNGFNVINLDGGYLTYSTDFEENE